MQLCLRLNFAPMCPYCVTEGQCLIHYTILTTCIFPGGCGTMQQDHLHLSEVVKINVMGGGFN